MTSTRLTALPEAASLDEPTSCGPIRSLRHHKKTGPRTMGRYHPYRTKYTEGDDMDGEAARKLLQLKDLHAMKRVQPGLTIASIVAEMEGRSTPAAEAHARAEAPVSTSASKVCAWGERCKFSRIVSLRELLVLREFACSFAWACMVQEVVVRLHRCM
ncbi:hypothetical protein K525DRAFT_291130 [Schizophyllum commune Loenen D]|nr:hypothetical protein K525DRAFT_291130 [Schizophyllum commune Loenen D]